MKYKNINSMAHNFVHSFLSYTNFYDNGYVVDDIIEQAQLLKPEQKLLIQFFPFEKADDSKFNERVRKSIASYREAFPRHCQAHKIQPEAITLFQASLLKNSSHQLLGYALVIDDKGKKYEEYVSF